jgi:hypothetical protein
VALYTEQHYTVAELAALWALSQKSVRRLFAGEDDVLRYGKPSRRSGRKLTRRYYTMTVPASTAARVYSRLCARKTAVSV